MINKEKWTWIRQPKKYLITDDKIEIVTERNTDLWQKTYYNFINDNAPILVLSSSEEYFSFTVKAQFEGKVRYDQCGIAIYQDSENWLKASIEYENEFKQHLGSVVTNRGFSDWSTIEIDSSSNPIWYRLSRRKSDYKLEYSFNGIEFYQMRITHLEKGDGTIYFGLYACSPENSSFKATFSKYNISECLWYEHDGQSPNI